MAACKIGSVTGQIGLSLHQLVGVGQTLVKINGRSPHDFITLINWIEWLAAKILTNNYLHAFLLASSSVNKHILTN